MNIPLSQECCALVPSEAIINISGQSTSFLFLSVFFTLFPDFPESLLSYTGFRKKCKKNAINRFLPDFAVEMRGKDGFEESKKTLVSQSTAKIQHVWKEYGI